MQDNCFSASLLWRLATPASLCAEVVWACVAHVQCVSADVFPELSDGLLVGVCHPRLDYQVLLQSLGPWQSH